MAVKNFFKVGERIRWENIIVSVMAVAVVCFTGFVGFSVGRVIWDKVAEAVHHPQEYLDAAVSVQVVELDYVVSRSPLSDEGSSDITLVQAPCGHGVSPRVKCVRYVFSDSAKKVFPLAVARYKVVHPGREIPSEERMESFLEDPPYVYAAGGKLKWPAGMRAFLRWLGEPAKLKYVAAGRNPDGTMHQVGEPVPEDNDFTNWFYIKHPEKFEGQAWR